MNKIDLENYNNDYQKYISEVTAYCLSYVDVVHVSKIFEVLSEQTRGSNSKMKAYFDDGFLNTSETATEIVNQVILSIT